MTPTLALVPRHQRRRVGVGLLAFGMAGLVLTLAAAVLVFASLRAVDDAATGFERQRAELVSMLAPASNALTQAANSATRVGVSISVTSDAADRGAALATSLAASFEGLAALGSFDILGARPFAGLSSQFSTVAADSRTLAADLRAATAAMRTNVDDSAAIAADIRVLAGQLDRLGASLGAPGSSAAPDLTLQIGLARLVLVGLLVWLAMPALGSAWLGWRLVRRRNDPA